MPKMQEIPHKCDICGNDFLILLGMAARWDRLLHTGGPGQLPRPMGVQWAFYRCVACGFEGPWPRQFMGSRELVQQYSEILDMCKKSFLEKTISEEKLAKIQTLLNAEKIMSTLPNTPNNFELLISNAVTPLVNKIKIIQEELNRRKGGRPKKIG